MYTMKQHWESDWLMLGPSYIAYFLLGNRLDLLLSLASNTAIFFHWLSFYRLGAQQAYPRYPGIGSLIEMKRHIMTW